MANIRVKICGLTQAEDAKTVAKAGAAYAGLVFFEKSPRHLDLERAKEIALALPEGLAKVALTVNAGTDQLDQILGQVPIDILQLHGSESPANIAALKDRYGLPVMKALGIADEADLGKIAEYEAAADMLLIDAKPPKASEIPGGNGLTFDWRLIAGRRWTVPWMLAGGLTPLNVAEAVRLTGAQQVDVSSGVESAPGVKDAALIHSFVSAAQADQAA